MTTYSGSRPMRASAVAEPNRELHMDVNMSAPMASNMPTMPYAVRSARKGADRSSNLTICGGGGGATKFQEHDSQYLGLGIDETWFFVL